MHQLGQPFFQQQESHRTDQRACHGADAAEDDDDHQLAGSRPVHDVGRNIFLPAGEQRAGEPADHRRDHIAGDLEMQRHEAHRLDPAFIAANGFEHHAEARAHDHHQQQADNHQRRPDQVIEAQRVPQVDRHEIGAVDAHPVIAAIGLQADEQEIQHLRKGQRDHDEIDARRPQRQEPDHQPQQAAGGKAHGDMCPAVVEAVKLADADAIGTDADEGGVAERHHPTIAEHEVQPHRRHAKQHDPHGQIVPERLVHDAGQHRKQRKACEDQPQQAVPRQPVPKNGNHAHRPIPSAGTGRSAGSPARATSGYRPSSRPAPAQPRRQPPGP